MSSLSDQINAYPSQIAFAAFEDGKECPCRNGWLLNPYDFWQECPIHYKGQDHPEAYRGDEDEILPPREPYDFHADMKKDFARDIEEAFDDCPF